ncbi:unnamed protein product [Brassicogethes aeneus]|uniref:Cytoplasmic dynein 2 heavy chain 1 n=1 Tax=Brassicogethes aeneus TaxID=1431903 RepID=A0A9P0B3L2_BRAAE|nr:unnamed protein product [Brassicogethes aeneus]
MKITSYLRKKEIEEELSEVEPLIQEARSAVGNIKSESLSEIRSLRAPPEVIRDILEGVLRLMGIQDTSWNSMKTFLAKRGVKEEIRRISTDSRLAVERLMSNKSDSFDEKSAKRASLAAAPLAAWVKANVKYSHVMDKIKPLEREQNKLQKNLKEAELHLVELSSGLSDVDAAVVKLKEKLSAYTKEAAEIEIDLNRAKETLNAAEDLVNKLNDEYERWKIQLQECQLKLQTLHHNCLLASAFIMYLSNANEEGRQNNLKEWMSEMGINEFNFESFLSTEREQLLWQSQGLPFDKLSIQNAISILKVFIEQFGKILIIEEIENIPSVLYPLLRNECFQQGERKLIKLNGKTVDFNSSFKLILCSRNTELQLIGDVKPLINIFNFTVTGIGLTNQLLFAAIKQENPDLENRRKLLLSEKEKLKEKQEMYQNQLLEDLANSTGDILQNKVIEKKVDSQIRHLFVIIYNYMARGIFKQDRLKFLLHLAHKLYSVEIPENEWKSFLCSNISTTKLPDDLPSWIPEQCVNTVFNLKNLLPELYENLKFNENQLWTNFLKSNDVETTYPSHVNLTDFQKILIVQAFRPEKLYSAMQTNILQITGLKSLDPQNVELSHILKESVFFEPILVLSMPGTDPSIEIKELAQQTIGNDNYIEIAMGEGQETLALKSLQEIAQSGRWLILKNLQLVTNWLPSLCQSFKDVEKHENFRLWLISEPTDKFNSVLTQNSLKIVYEASQGIRNNLLRSFSSYGKKYFENLNPTASKIFFIICCIHALLQERRKYIPQGWSKYYDFSDTDLSTCIKLVEDIWQSPSPKIQWTFISGLCGETVYGGRIEKNDDMKILQVYVKQYFVDEVLSHQWKLFGKTNIPNSASYNTPLKWINIWSGPKEPMQYLRTSMRNLIFLSKLKDEDADKILQNSINLSYFFNPRGFLASYKQDVSR